MPITPVCGEIKAQPLNDNFSYLDSKLSDVTGGPKGTYDTLEDLKKAHPNGALGIYVVIADGCWYAWDGAYWIKGAIYQSTGIADSSITNQKIKTGEVTARTIGSQAVTIDKIARESVSKSKIVDNAVDSTKTSFINPYSINLFNYLRRNAKKALNQRGELVDSENYFTTHFIEVNKNDQILTNFTIQTYVVYDSTKKILMRL